MKVGTDAVLLGCLCQQDSPKHALDIGTGSGIIALQLAQRFSDCQIDALELDETAARQAAHNFMQSPWSARLQSICTDVRSWQIYKSYDLVVCNPPFYPHSFPAQGAERQQAREQQTLNYGDLARAIHHHLNEQGSVWCILPANFETHWDEALVAVGLTPFHKTYIEPVEQKAANRLVVGASKAIKTPSRASLIIRSIDGSYTPAYLQLTRDFYLFA